MRQKVADFVGDPQQTRFADKYNDALDRAQEQFAFDSKALWQDESWTTASGTATYSLPSTFMYEDWVTYDGAELTPISRHEIQRLYGKDWSTETGTPSHFIVDPEEASKTVRLVPIPEEAKTLIMRFYPFPTSLSADSSIPLNASLLMYQFHYGMCAFAAFDLLMSEESTQAIVEKRRSLLFIYNDAKDKAITTFKNTQSAPIKIRGTRIWS